MALFYCYNLKNMTGCGGACNMPIMMGGGAGIGCGGACPMVAFGGYSKNKKKCNCKTKKTSTKISSKTNNTTKTKKPSKNK